MRKLELLAHLLLLVNLAAVGAGLLRGWLLSRSNRTGAWRRMGWSAAWALAIAVACQAAAFVYVRYVEPNWIVVTHLRVRHDRLAQALGRARLVQITDLHLEHFGPREWTMIRQVNRQHPDWIVITGDLINRAEHWPAAMQVVKRLRASQGVWVVPGNTDNYYISREQFERDLQAAGARVLRNANASLGLGGAWLVGVDDPVERRARLDIALDRIDQRNPPPMILLAHSPDIMPAAVEAHIPLVLVGHTHGGQLGFDWMRRLSAYADRGPYMSGRYQVGDTLLYVNRGIGTKTAPYRFLASPEVTVIEFAPSQGASGHAAPVPAPPAAPAAPSPAAATQPSARERPWQVGWESALTKVFRDPKAFQGRRADPVQIAMAANEYESVQLVLLGGAREARLRVTVGPITRTDGTATFPADVVEVRRVGYVTTKQPDYPTPRVGDWPDPLPLADEIDVPAGKAQPVWITIGAPEWLPAGRYEGTITVTDREGRVKELALEVRVWDFVLPRTPHLRTAFGFFPGQLVKAYKEFVPGGIVWTGQTAELERRYLLEMLKHHLSPILDADPMGDRFVPTIDYYLKFGLTAFGIGSYGGNLDRTWPANPEEMKRLMRWYREAARTLRGEHLLDHAYVYTYDEPKADDPRVAEVLAELHRADPELRNLLVMHEAPDPVRDAQWLKDADILCLRLASFDPADASQLHGLGKALWFYVSSPVAPFPGLVIDEAAIGHRLLPWMAWKYGADGLLYWCVNFWRANPWINPATYTEGQNGNGSLLYPGSDGPVPSIRLEVLRDGIEDYEYLYRLQELVQRAAAVPGTDPALLAQARRFLTIDAGLVASPRRYADDPAVLLAQRAAIAEMIERLQRMVGH